MTTPVQIPTGERSPEAAARRAIWLALAALVMVFWLPIAGIILGMLALAAGIRATGGLRRAGKQAGVAIAGVVIAALSLLLSLLMTAFQLYFSTELQRYNDCIIGAGTVASQNECVDTLERGMERRMPFIPPGELQFPFAP